MVKTLDPAIDRAILRCLEPDPASRPSSALAVAAALPGGDPLAAALAAGEMPSPAMVAAVGGDAATLSPLAGVLWLTASVTFVVAAGAGADHASIVAKTPFSKSAAVLADRAEDIRTNLGYTDAPTDRAFGFTARTGYLDWAEKHGAGRSAWSVRAQDLCDPVLGTCQNREGGGVLLREPNKAVADNDRGGHRWREVPRGRRSAKPSRH